MHAIKKEIILNVNFGAFVTPQEEIVNSRSTWTHTFMVHELFKDLIHLQLREWWMIPWTGCIEIGRSFSEQSGIHQNVSAKDAQRLTTSMYKNLMNVVDTFNEQRALLIEAIDHNIESY